MYGHTAAQRMSDVNGGLHFLEGERLKPGHVVPAAVEPNILIHSAPAPICCLAARITSAGPST